VILGAGFGRRFGSDKRWHVLPSRRTLLAATLAAYRRAFNEVIVVLRPEDAGRVEQLDRDSAEGDGAAPLTVVFCADAAHGMGHSLAAGARAVGDGRSVFVGLGDMPFLQPKTLRALIDTLSAAVRTGDQRCIVQPHCSSGASTGEQTPRGGHPVGFGPGLLAELRHCRGDRGARQLLEEAGPHLLRPTFDDAGLLRDVDVPDDLPAG